MTYEELHRRVYQGLGEGTGQAAYNAALLKVIAPFLGEQCHFGSDLLSKALELLARYQGAARCRRRPGRAEQNNCLMSSDCPCEVCTVYRECTAFYGRLANCYEINTKKES